MLWNKLGKKHEKVCLLKTGKKQKGNERFYLNEP